MTTTLQKIRRAEDRDGENEFAMMVFPPVSSIDRPRAWPLAVAFLVALFGMLVANAMLAGAVLAFYSLHGHHPLEQLQLWAMSAFGLSASAGVSGLVLAVVSLGGAKLSGEPVAARLRLGPSIVKAPHILATALATFAAGIVFGQLTDFLGFSDVGVLAVVSKSIAEASWPAWSVSIVGLAIVPGFAEELFFRGFLQTRAEARWGRAAGVIVAALLFGLFHMDLKQGSFAFLVGLFLGWVASRARSIRPSMIGHGVSNFLGLLLGKLGVGPSTTVMKITTLVFAIFTIAVAIFFIARRTRRSTEISTAP
jgi:membrane protease YdiL (CAAX protease family)